VSESISEPGPGTCPVDPDFQIRLWFTQLSFLTDQSVVTSLVTDDPRLQIVCAQDPSTEASTGALLIRLALQFLIDKTDVDGHLAFKELAEDGQTFNLGPVVEGIEALSAVVKLTSEHTQDLGDGRTLYQGRIGIDVDTVGDRELNVQITRLDGATEEFFEEIMYLGLPDDEETGFRSSVNIPASLGITSPELVLRLRVLARQAGTTPQLTITGRVVPAPAEDGTALPTTETAVTLATIAPLDQDEYIDFESDPISVGLGDQFFFTVIRESDDAYVGEIGIMQQVVTVSSGG
jgi:hypothetical protein